MKEVRLENVTKSYDGVTLVIPGINLLCIRGEMLALLGPSGCGKSTTLKMIAGIESISDGAIYFDDTDVSDLDTASRNVAMVFEDYALYPHLSVFDNIAFPLSIRGMPGPEITERVERVLKLLGLRDISTEKVQQLSGGAQQRVSIGRALVREPDLIMFDEPLSHLDSDQKVQLRTEIKRLQQTSKLTSVLVTHDQNEAISMADRIAVMDKGILQQVDTPSAIYNQPANIFVASFIGEPPMNLLDAHYSSASGQARIHFGHYGEVAADQSVIPILHQHGEGKALVVGIRPERVQINPDEASLLLSARVYAHEPGGDSDVVTLDTVIGRIVAEAPAPLLLVEGDELQIGLDPQHFYYFCKEAGHNLLLETS
jgi:multiple sugar transport system ATP-binding protein